MSGDKGKKNLISYKNKTIQDGKAESTQLFTQTRHIHVYNTVKKLCYNESEDIKLVLNNGDRSHGANQWCDFVF